MKKKLVVAVALLLFLAAVKFNFEQQQTIARLQSDLSYVHTTYLQKVGALKDFGSYDLRSIDGGKNWYFTERTSDGGLLILGPVEEIRPGLLDAIRGWDNLINYVEKNGPITLAGANVTNEINLIKNVGFEVK